MFQLPSDTSLWQQAEHGYFDGVQNLALRYCILRQPAARTSRGALVLCTGRGDSFSRYWPQIEWLYQQGFCLYLWDHRGQGLSARLLPNRQVGHVQHFDDYVADMTRFIREKLNPDNPTQRYLLGHSMGGAIATLYLAKYPHQFDKAMLVAPMMDINLPAPRKLLTPLLALFHRLRPTGYAIGGSDYQVKPFADNPYTGDRAQFDWNHWLHQQQPELQVGSPSVHWIRHALAVCDRLSNTQVTTPLLLAIAEQERIVSNPPIYQFAERGGHQTLTIEDGRHELLMERPPLRQQLYNALLQWFN
ncbi:alpha/beta fold hydrolase [Ferrimonas senticii]|uniref:alpha/beta fold hydrolase n=1 Tax=Ferrimonas senticii TaxID=394566 RepID=UPI00041078DA|nr:alpha/beta fold hydrolase [Ferrimonas senticii]